MKNLRIIKVCFIALISIWACKVNPKGNIKKFDSKDAKIQMDIPSIWEFQSSSGSKDSSTQYHEQYKRTDNGGFIDIETKFNQTYRSETAKPVSSASIMAGLIQSMKKEDNLYKDLTILDERNDAVNRIVICKYIWGKKNELTYSLLAVSQSKEITKIIKVETWDQLKEKEQLSILTTVKNSLKM
jgi:hypothetical protein